MSLACEWDDCTTKCDTRDALCAHVREHSRHLHPNWPPPSDESLHAAYPGETMGCLWKDCPYESDSPLQLLLHVSFHPYHAYIKEEGRRVQAKENLTVCSYGDETRNLVPPIGEVLVCQWRDCGEQFYCPNSFYSHVEEHGLKAPRDQTEDGKSILKCLWKDCNSVAKDKHKLKGHCTVHTHKKAVACPTCGALFSCKTKLRDHYIRQASIDEACYQCSHCLKRLPSERLLRDHMNQHVSRYKCHLCPMTCPTTSALRRHVAHRHSEKRPYSCDICNFSSKTASDLKRHKDTHSLLDPYKCPQCSQTFRCAPTFRAHFRLQHQTGPENVPLYQCHMCERIFCHGGTLSTHLVNVHYFKLPPGHTRFRYVENADGFHRLQTVRFESLHLASGAPVAEVAAAGKDLSLMEQQQLTNLEMLSETACCELLDAVSTD